MQNLSLQDALSLFGDYTPRNQMDMALDSIKDARETLYDPEDKLKSDAFTETCSCLDRAMECIRVLYRENWWGDPL